MDSAGWTGSGEAADKPRAPLVCGAFHGREAMDEAKMRLTGSVFDRSQVSVRMPAEEPGAGE